MIKWFYMTHRWDHNRYYTPLALTAKTISTMLPQVY